MKLRSFVTGAIALALPLAVLAQQDLTEDLATARAMDARGRHAEALFYYAKVLVVQPADRVALFELGMMEARLGLVEPAQTQLERLRAACSTCPEVARLERAITSGTEVGRAEVAPLVR